MAKDNDFCSLELPVKSVSDVGVNPTPEELERFLPCGKQWVLKAVRRACVVLHVGDRVEVVGGSLKGLMGYVRSLDAKGTVTLCVKDLKEDLYVHQSMVVWKFELGDFVRVIHGQHRGLEGCITYMKDGAVSFFSSKVFRELGEVRK